MQTGSSATENLYAYAGRRISSWAAANNAGNEGRIYWDGTQFAFRDIDGTTYFDHQDWLGTERMRTDYTGAIASSYVSLPFGDGYTAKVIKANAEQGTLHFAELDHDPESTTDHAQFRQYSPTQGRWLSPDAYSGSYDATNPQSMNRYSYVGNNPLRFVDPSGLLLLPPGVGGGGGYVDSSNIQFGSGWDEFSQFDTICAEGGCYTYTDGTWKMVVADGYGSGIIDDPGGDGAVDCLGASGYSPCGFIEFTSLTGLSLTPDTIGLQSLLLVNLIAANKPTPTLPVPTRYFGTHYCGPGGAGNPVNTLDVACKAHDDCYDANGFTSLSNYNASLFSNQQAGALQACNQALCNAARGPASGDLGSY